MSDQERFLKLTYKASTCWFWLGCRSERGYGKFFFRKKLIEAHRAAYVMFRGEIPERLQVLHQCDIKQCVNPDHLFLGTQKDNHQDSISKGAYGGGVQNLFKTHCAHGHKLEGRNIKPCSTGDRGCRTCANIHRRASRKRKLAALAALEREK